MLPPLPAWEGMHPLVVHFPIALLTVLPVVLLFALLWPARRRALHVAALVVLVLGTGAAFLAVATGEAAEELAEEAAEGAPDLEEAIHEHEELGESVRTVYAVLTFLFAGFVIAEAKGKLAGPGSTVGAVVLLLAAAFGAVLVANTSHLGGLLVHYYGVHAPQPVP